MGICASCLGLRQRAGQHESSETSRLLYDDHNQYGTLNGGISHGVVQIDPQDIQREEAASQRILAQTSEHLIDILALQSPMSSSAISTDVDSATDAKQKRYQALVQQVLSGDLKFEPRQKSIDGNSKSLLNGSGETTDEYVLRLKTIRRDNVGPLVAGFSGWQGGNMSIQEVKG